MAIRGHLKSTTLPTEMDGVTYDWKEQHLDTNIIINRFRSRNNWMRLKLMASRHFLRRRYGSPTRICSRHQHSTRCQRCHGNYCRFTAQLVPRFKIQLNRRCISCPVRQTALFGQQSKLALDSLHSEHVSSQISYGDTTERYSVTWVYFVPQTIASNCWIRWWCSNSASG